jgi:integrase
MPVIRCPDGRTISGSILGQLNYVLKEATNNHRFGVKVKDILEEGYTKQENPYIRSFKTAREYYGIWKNLALYVKREFGINRLDQIQPQHVEKFIEDKAELSAKQLKNISSAVGKLETVLREKFSLNVNYGDRELQTGRWFANKIASEMENSSNRGAYERPKDLINHLTGNHRLVAQLQYEGGLRIHEVSGIRPSRLSGGGITVRGKGGYVRTVSVSRELYERVRDVVEENGRIDFNYSQYLEALKEASLYTGQAYQGSHGLRYNFAQETYDRLISEGYGHNEALKEVSEMLGHHRPEITLHYLGKR